MFGSCPENSTTAEVMCSISCCTRRSDFRSRAPGSRCSGSRCNDFTLAAETGCCRRTVDPVPSGWVPRPQASEHLEFSAIRSALRSPPASPISIAGCVVCADPPYHGQYVPDGRPSLPLGISATASGMCIHSVCPTFDSGWRAQGAHNKLEIRSPSTFLETGMVGNRFC